MPGTFTPDDAADTQALLKTGFDDLYCCYRSPTPAARVRGFAARCPA